MVNGTSSTAGIEKQKSQTEEAQEVTRRITWI
jgi:hypothetical protein